MPIETPTVPDLCPKCDQPFRLVLGSVGTWRGGVNPARFRCGCSEGNAEVAVSNNLKGDVDWAIVSLVYDE